MSWVRGTDGTWRAAVMMLNRSMARIESRERGKETMRTAMDKIRQEKVGGEDIIDKAEARKEAGVKPSEVKP